MSFWDEGEQAEGETERDEKMVFPVSLLPLLQSMQYQFLSGARYWDVGQKRGEGSMWPVVTPLPDQCPYTVRTSSGHFPSQGWCSLHTNQAKIMQPTGLGLTHPGSLQPSNTEVGLGVGCGSENPPPFFVFFPSRSAKVQRQKIAQGEKNNANYRHTWKILWAWF